ncbi:hypothetical protein [Sorangium sp. So ce128]|uniref:hypothetical protein n=1 Tax=Sorangium sp. So ce128 TaxID=3133281 RepID=UPI003F5E4B4D
MDDNPESEIVRQFRELAGAPQGTNDFHMSTCGCPLRVKYSPGSVSSLTLSAPYPSRMTAPAHGPLAAYRHPGEVFVAVRPMKIKLRRETDEDRGARSRGVVREVQTGDPLFDDAVYVDSRSDPQTVLRALASPELRGGVRALLAEGIEHVILDDKAGEISALLLHFTRAPHSPDRASRVLGAFAAVVLNVPSVSTSSEQRPADVERALLIFGAVLCLLLLFIGVPVYLLAAGQRCDFENNPGANVLFSLDGCFTPFSLGLAAGLLVGPLLAAAVARRFHGRSDSLERSSAAYAVTLVLSVQLAVWLFAALLWLR